ncbi:MAG TPA: hypothetical protein DDX92_14345 [Flavobacteriales bacterium]|jgi:hypothetical protein|nr:hypothetical protein [Flavobacteriales bacterium]
MKRLLRNGAFFASLLLVTTGIWAQPGSTFTNSLVVASLPFAEVGATTCGFGDFYTTADIACTGSYMNGDEIIYSYTPGMNMTNVTVAMTNISDTWSGIYITDDSTTAGNCIASVTNSASTDRVMTGLNFVAGTTYYIIISTLPSPQCITSFDLDIFNVTCPAPDSLAVSNITTTSADLSWVETGTATNWEIQYDTSGFTPGTGTFVSTVSIPYNITGLSNSTFYDAYVRSICGAGDTSMWLGPITFRTDLVCPGLNPATLPYSEDFESITATVTTSGTFACDNSVNWEFTTDQVGGRARLGTDAPSASTGAGAMVLDRDPSGALTTNYVDITLDLSSYAGSVGVELSFDLADFGDEVHPEDRVWVRGSDTDTWVEIYDWSSGHNATWATVSGLDVDAALSGAGQVFSSTFQIRFGQSDDFPHSSDGLGIDNILLAEILCAIPDSLYAQNVAATTADLNWVENGSATQWEVEYGLAGFTQGTGMTMIAGAQPLAVSGLVDDSDYEFYVRAICGPGDTSLWSLNPGSFKTACLPVTGPVLDDVEAQSPTTSANIGLCWSTTPSNTTSSYRWNVDGSGSTPSSGTGPSGAYSGSNYFYTEASSGAQGDVAELYTPLVDISAMTNPEMSFFYHMFGVEMGNLYIEVFDGSTWVLMDSIIGEQQVAQGDPWLERIIDVSSFSGVIQARFISTKGGSSFEGDMCLDDISVREPLTCFAVDSLMTSNITATSADLMWTDPQGAAQWEIEYGTAGFMQGMGTSVIVGTNPYTLGGLMDATDYDFYVRAICSAGDSSLWAGPASFTTPCLVFSTPMLETFDNTTIPNCWSTYGNDTWKFTSTWPGWGASGLAEHTGNGGSFAGVDGSSPAPVDATFETPPIDISTLMNPELLFWVFSNNVDFPGDNASLTVEVFDGAVWTSELVYAADNPDWVPVQVDLSGYSGVISIRFIVDGSGMTNDAFYNDIVIDDFSVAEALPCPIRTPVVLPYIEDFEMTADTTIQDSGSFLITCNMETEWNFTSSTIEGRVRFGNDSPESATGTGAMLLDRDPSGAFTTNLVEITLDMTAYASDTNLELSFDIANFGDEPHPEDRIWIRGSDTSLWLEIFDWTVIPNSGVWFNVGGLDIDTLLSAGGQTLSSTFQIGIGQNDNFPYPQGDGLGIDNLTIASVTCISPDSLVASSVGQDSAIISWANPSGATQWVLEYGPAGFTPGNGMAMVTSSNPYTLTGLVADSLYWVYVSAICGPGDTSLASFPVPFRTLCNVFATPYLEDFTAGWLPSTCWAEALGGDPVTGPGTPGTSNWIEDGFANNGTTGAVKVNLWTVGVSDWMLSPSIDLTGGNHQLEFDFGIYGWNTTTPATLGSDDQVQVLITTDGVTWTSLAVFDSTYVTSPAGNHEVISLAAYTGSVVQIAIWATDGTVDDPENNDVFVDNFEVRIPANDDLSTMSILSPVPGCGLGLETVTMVIENRGLIAQSGFDVGYTLDGTSITPETVADTVQPGDTLVYSFTTLADLTPLGLHVLDVYTLLAGDIDTSNDSINGYTLETKPQASVSVNDESACAGDSVTLTATAGLDYYVWSDASGLIQSGSSNTLSLVSMAGSNDYIVDGFTILSSSNVGPVDNTIGTGGPYTFFTDGLVFNALSAFVLDSVTVYADGAGIVQVNVFDAGLNLVGSSAVSVPSAGAFRIPVGIIVPEGSGYIIDAQGSTVLGLYRNNGGAVYPYTDGSTVEITEAINGLAGFYYFFYDWSVTAVSCPGTDTATVVGSAGPAISLGADTSSCESFTLDAGAGFASYMWQDGSMNQTFTVDTSSVTPGTPTDVSVMVTDSAGCSASDTVNVILFAPVVVNLGPDTISSSVPVILDAGAGYASYLWQDGSTLQTDTADATGFYWVEVMDFNGCMGSDTVYFDYFISIGGILNDAEIKVYPVPASEELTLDMSGLTGSGDITLRMFNANGQIVLDDLIPISSSRMIEPIDVSGFAAGTYSMQLIIDGEQLIQTVTIR